MIKTTRLHVEMFAVSQMVTLEVLELPELRDELLLRMKTKFATSGIKKVEHLVPINALEHFKKDYFPKFLLKRFPVKYKTLQFDCREIFPEYSHLVQENGQRYLDVAYVAELRIS